MMEKSNKTMIVGIDSSLIIRENPILREENDKK